MKLIFAMLTLFSSVAVAEEYDLVAYTLVLETGHLSKVITLGTFDNYRWCEEAMRRITVSLSPANHQVGLFCIEKSVAK